MNYSFKQFQEELRALDGNSTAAPETPYVPPPVTIRPLRPVGRPPGKKALEAQRLAQAKSQFLALRDKYQLNIGEVVAFFPEDEGLAYLMGLLQQPVRKKRGRKPKSETNPA